MAHKLIITAYQPDFSSEFKSWVKKNINPSMINAESSDDEASYFLDTILDDIMNAYVLSVEDHTLIMELQSQKVEYVEF